MKISDLRIGNIISARYHNNDCPSPTFYWVPVTIATISSSFITITTGERIDFDESLLRPLGVTRDNLFSIGIIELVMRSEVKHTEVKMYYEHTLQMNGLSYTITSDHLIELAYLHQVQNLHFALSGKELSIIKTKNPLP